MPEPSELTDAPVYEFYDPNANSDVHGEELMAWQDKQAEVLAKHLEKQREAEKERRDAEERRRKDRRDLISMWVIGLLIVAAILAALYGLYRFYQWGLHNDQDEWYVQHVKWASQCEKAGGRVVGDYGDRYSQYCVFPNGAEIPRNNEAQTS